MTIHQEICNECEAKFKGHGCDIGGIIRDHTRKEHPEIYQEMVKKEKEIFKLQQELKDIARKISYKTVFFQWG